MAPPVDRMYRTRVSKHRVLTADSPAHNQTAFNKKAALARFVVACSTWRRRSVRISTRYAYMQRGREEVTEAVPRAPGYARVHKTNEETVQGYPQ